MADSTFRAGGLASGIDTNSIIDQLVTLESQPLTTIQKRQSGLQTQISTLGDIVSKLSTLATAAQNLGDSGALATRATSTNTTFSATPGSSAVAGRYSVQVQALAHAAKWRSVGMDPSAGHPGGTMTLTVQGKTYDPIKITDGESLADLAEAIRKTGAPVSAVVLSDGTKSYLSVTNRDTGVPMTGAALKIDFSPTKAAAPDDPPVYSEIEPAQNAKIVVDKLTFSRPSNTISDAVPGATLTLNGEGAAEDLVLDDDATATQANLQQFVTAYNSVMKVLNNQLSPAQGSDRSATLAGNSTVRSLQAQLQAMLVTKVGSGTVRTLADLGVKTAKDGSLSIDATVLQSAISREPDSVNALFSTAGTGLGTAVQTLVDNNTRAGDGLLTMSISSLQGDVTDLGNQADDLNRRIDQYRTNLVNQFTAMEQTISSLKSAGNYLTSYTSSLSSSK